MYGIYEVMVKLVRAGVIFTANKEMDNSVCVFNPDLMQTQKGFVIVTDYSNYDKMYLSIFDGDFINYSPLSPDDIVNKVCEYLYKMGGEK